jgi:hypothetical protein
MKTAPSIVLCLAFGFLTAIDVFAQDAPVIMPSSIQQAGYDHDYYSASQESANAATDKAAPAVTACKPGCEPTGCTSCDGCGQQSCRWCCDGALADPWAVPQPAFLKDRNVTIGGWLSGGVYGNQYGAASNGPVGLRNVGDGFTADQLWLFAERKTDTKGCGWDIGGRIDYLFGSDGPDTQCFGDRSWDYGWNSARDYGSAIPQMYAEIAYNDLKVKGGHFYTPIGYEVVQATGNFFYSHSYSHTFGEPFTHTGLLAEYAYNENVKVSGGWVNGWDEGFDGRDGGSMFLGGLALTLSEKATLAWYCTAGRIGTGNAFAGAASGDVYMNSIVFSYKLSEKWTYVFEHDLGCNYNVDQRGVDSQWYEINNYLMYKVNDCLSYGGRFEWFQDPQGTRVVAGDRGSYYAVTGGFNYKPHANITIRPEIRYDCFNAFAGSAGEPFNDGAASSQFSGGMDVIFTY